MFLHVRQPDSQEEKVLSSSAGGSDDDSDDLPSLVEEPSEFDELFFGECTVEDLDMAIERCRQKILSSSVGSRLRESFVAQLVRLRLRRLRLTDPDEEDQLPQDIRQLHGHQLQLQPFGRLRARCEHCCRNIFGVFHSWLKCRGCELSVHAACVDSLTRCCVLRVLQSSDTVHCELRICPEVGLGVQKFRCAECHCQLAPVNCERSAGLFGVGSAGGGDGWSGRLCDYTGHYYCERCHWHDTAVLPARVVNDWDFDKHPVCRASLQYLTAVFTKPLINLERLNVQLFGFVEELNHVKKLREELMVMKQYLVSCRAALSSGLLLSFHDRQYFVESSHMYSLRDLCDVPSGRLIHFLAPIHAKFDKHIQQDCEACSGKGHICEVCRRGPALFSFHADTISCGRCGRVMHAHCYSAPRDGHCPRCQRHTQRLARHTSAAKQSGSNSSRPPLPK